MSRVGKSPISIPDDVEVDVSTDEVKIKGPEGTLTFEVRSEIEVQKEDSEIKVKPKQETKQTEALWGTARTIIANMVKGVKEKYKKKLKIKGLGYKAKVKNNKLELEVGFSHPVELEKPEEIEFEVDQDENIITVTGINKDKVGRVAAKIRNVKPPEPYKGKGIRYVGEEIERKEGKRAVTAEGGPGAA